MSIWIGVLGWLSLTPLRAVTVDAPGYDEYQLKAAFLFHFAQLTTWPASAFPSGDESFVICTVNGDPFDGSLEKTIGSKKVQGHSIKVAHVQRAAEAHSCQMVFIPALQRGEMSAMVNDLGNLPILTVGDDESFTQYGGMIAFRRENDRLRFDVNLGAITKSNLNVSSMLLSLARAVSTR
ncbi:YfiR family protein [Terriglobus albidus]|uniref:YfiR family protein n=1 Tax=Terriglobus albidus TaxID=1592106 RepID=UPI0021E03FC5|nr:YfiR family protein [Terriglobus albidus]